MAANAEISKRLHGKNRPGHIPEVRMILHPELRGVDLSQGGRRKCSGVCRDGWHTGERFERRAT